MSSPRGPLSQRRSLRHCRVLRPPQRRVEAGCWQAGQIGTARTLPRPIKVPNSAGGLSARQVTTRNPNDGCETGARSAAGGTTRARGEPLEVPLFLPFGYLLSDAVSP